MPYIIYKRIRNASGFDEEIWAVCSNKNKESIQNRLMNYYEETPRLIDLKRQRQCQLDRIKKLQESRFRINTVGLDNILRGKIRALEKIAHTQIDKEIGERQSRLAKLEREISDEKKNGFPFRFEPVELLRE